MFTRKLGFKKTAFELICLTLVFCMIFGIMPLYASEPEESAARQIVVLKKSFRKGVMLTGQYLELKTLSDEEKMPENAVTDIGYAKGKYAKYDLYEGEYLQKDQLSSTKIAAANSALLKKPIAESDDAYVVVTDYIDANTEKDLSGAIQELINKNPNRTIYFPDGVYLISKPIFISGKASDTVSLELSDGAVIKAAKTWKSSTVTVNRSGNSYTEEVTTNSLITIGEGFQNNNNVKVKGSYFGLKGGILDGDGRADGVLYSGGRESLIRNLCIKNVTIGITIEYGVNNGSSDADFEDIAIYGDPSNTNSKGIYVRGHDNTFTNIRIYDMHTAVDSRAGSSLYKNIYATITDPAAKASYDQTRAFYSSTWAWFSQCTAENYALGYSLGNSTSVISDCIAIWNSDACAQQTVFSATALPVGGIRAEFYGESANTAFFKDYSFKNALEGCLFNEALEDANKYAGNLKTPVIPLS